MRKKSFLDEDNTFTRGVKRGANSAFNVRPIIEKYKVWIQVSLGVLLLFLVVRFFF